MADIQQKIGRFFDNYAARMNGALGESPSVDVEEFYRKIGTQSMNITDRQITQLDEFHWMVKVHWKAEYLTRAEKRETIEFDVIYFVQILNDDETPKIFAYITGDEQRVMREHGLIDPEAISEGVIG